MIFSTMKNTSDSHICQKYPRISNIKGFLHEPKSHSLVVFLFIFVFFFFFLNDHKISADLELRYTNTLFIHRNQAILRFRRFASSNTTATDTDHHLSPKRQRTFINSTDTTPPPCRHGKSWQRENI